MTISLIWGVHLPCFIHAPPDTAVPTQSNVFTPLLYLSAPLFPRLNQPPKCVKLGSAALAGKNLRKQQVYDIVLGKQIFNVKI